MSSIAVEIARPRPLELTIRYVASGTMEGLRIPAPFTLAGEAILENLWRFTCFEAFVRTPGERAYFEFNFSPSCLTRVFAFGDYRARINDLSSSPVQVETQSEGTSFTLSAALSLENELIVPVDSANERLPRPAADRPLQVGLSAVIEEANGRMSYWALAHPPGKPDFHHPDCFALHLPPPSSR